MKKYVCCSRWEPLEDTQLKSSSVPGPRKRPLQAGLIWWALNCPIVLTRTMNLKGDERHWLRKTQNNDVWLFKIIRWSFFSFYICIHGNHGNIVSWRWCQPPCLWSKKAVFSLHCVQNLIYRSWPRLLFCATAILENNGRKAWNLRGTESALFHFFLFLFKREFFLSLSKIALFLCPTGAINWCLSIPWPGDRATFN